MHISGILYWYEDDTYNTHNTLLVTDISSWRIAFNAILGSCVVLQQWSFLMPTVLLIYRQRSEQFLPRNRTFRLQGWIGWLVNIWVIVVILALMVFFFLPPILPVSANTMSKSSP